MTDPFDPFGEYPYDDTTTRFQEAYNAIIANLNNGDGDNFDMTVGGPIEATVYARATVLAAARALLDRVLDNASPGKATDTLPTHETEFQVVPGLTDTLATRRSALAARALLPKGNSYANVTAALTALLGADFLYYRITKSSEIINFPATGGDQPGNFVDPKTVIKNYIIEHAISRGLGSSQTVLYHGFDESVPELVVGDKLVVGPERRGLTETVEVEAVGTHTFQATFLNAHDPNTFATTAPYPYWRSTQRCVHIFVTRACAEDAEKRRKIDEFMDRIGRGVTNWVITPISSPGNAAQFTVGDLVNGRPSYAIIGSLTYP